MGRSLLVCGVGLWAACGGVSDSDINATGTSESEIIGGFAANGAKLNAVGHLGVALPGSTGAPEYAPFCTGTLITPETVLTARHCVHDFDVLQPYGVRFGIGPDGFAPVQSFEVVAVSLAAGDPDIFEQDVAVVHLAEPVLDVRPLPYRRISRSDVGKDFVAIGYGIQDYTETFGTRRAGRVVLRALEGRLYELFFGSYEAFRDYVLGRSGADGSELPGVLAELRSRFGKLARVVEPAPVAGDELSAGAGGSGSTPDLPIGGSAGEATIDDLEALLRAEYESVFLNEGDQVFVGGVPGNAQICNGDSGGPLLRMDRSGQYSVYGVASLVVDGCGPFGGVYASFGEEAREFLRRAKQWRDPCGGLSSAGVCNGDVARRCTNEREGERRLVEFDCSELGQVCAVQSDGEAGCSDPE